MSDDTAYDTEVESGSEAYDSDASSYSGSEEGSEEGYDTDASSISIEPSKKIKGAMSSKLGFTDKVCKFGDKSCRNKNIMFLVISFLLMFGVFFFLLKQMRCKFILDDKGHVSQKKLIMYSFLFGLIGPVLYFSYVIVTM